MINTVNKFIVWYVDRLTDNEVLDALKAVGYEVKKGRKKNLRNVLKDVWKNGPNELQAAISRYFEKQHKEAREEIEGKSRSQCRDELDDLVARYGIKSMAFVFIVNPDDFMKEIGYELLDKRGDEVKPVVEDEEDVIIDADDEGEEEKNDSGFDIVSKLEDIADIFRRGQVTEEIEKIDAAINKISKAWQEFKQSRIQKESFLSDVRKTLKELHKHSDVMKYLNIVEFPLQLEFYTSVECSDFERVKEILNDVNDICQEVNLLRGKKGSNINEDLENLKRQTYLGEQFEQKHKSLRSILKLPEQPEIVEQTEQPAIAEQPEQTEQLKESENEDSEEYSEITEIPQEYQKNLSSVSEDDVEPGDDNLSNENAESVSDERFEKQVKDKKIFSSIEKEGNSEQAEESNVLTVNVSEDMVSNSDNPSSGLVTNEPQLNELPPLKTSPDIPAQIDLIRTDSAETEDAYKPAADTVITDEVAIINLNTRDNLSDAERCFWETLQKGDYATAYWLTREMEDNPPEEGLLPPVPSWLILSLFLGREASWDDIEEKDRLYQICTKHLDDLDDLVERMGISERDLALLLGAAAIRPALFAPDTSAGSWVSKALSLINNPTDPLSELLQCTLNFSTYGKLDRKLLWQALDNVNWQEQARSLSYEVAIWRKEVSAKRIAFAPATKLLRFLAGPESIISDALDTVINNDFDKQKIVADIFDEFFDSRKSMHDLVQKTNQYLNRRKARIPDIDGQSLQQIMRALDQLRQLLNDWLETVQIGSSRVQKNDWWYKRTQDFKRAFEKCWVAYEPELREYSIQELDVKRIVIRNYALNTFNMLLDELTKPFSDKELKRKRDWAQILSRPLLLVRSAPIDEEGYVDIDKPLVLEDCFLQAVLEKRTLKDALRIHLDCYDFQLAELALQLLQETSDPQINDLYQEYEEIATHASISLKEKIDETRYQIVNATIEHVLKEEDRSKLEGQLLSIEQQETKRLSLLFQELNEISEQIKQLQTERRESLHEDIKRLSREIDERIADSGEQNNLKIAKRYLERSEKALEAQDLPLADEFLHYAERAFDTGVEYEVEEESDKINYVEDFVGVFESLNHYLEKNPGSRGPVELLSKGKSVAGLDMKRVPGARYIEIKKGLDAWLRIKRCKNIKDMANFLEEYLTDLLEYAGFQGPQVKFKDGDKKSGHFEARMSVGKLSPLADFGSQRNGVYNIVLVSDRPHAETIGNLLHIYGVFSTCPIVIFTGRMTLMQRREWSSYCRREGLTALMVDELILYYLASQRESRLPALISCGVAWGYSIPYQSFGVIPPEIFKGRTLMVKELGDPGGSCIVYGGRQFGKTAILHMVQREYDNPERGFYVIYDDIKALGDPHGHYRPEDLWPRLRDMLIERGILHKGVSHERRDISQKFIETLNNNKNMRVIVLLDECDYFLAADAEHNFEEVYELRRIMDQTNRRFKVVFCGLHSVQRYCSGQNHPFAQMMSRPLVIGPLEPRDARSLITEPMEAIGFSFNSDESKNAVLRILCYTNYHPALIQYFCGELIKLIRKKQSEPPYQVHIEDVEGIYRREDVRSFMRERFNWTLDLDTRYQVMVYSMIVEQLHEQDGYRREFTVSKALECAKNWWPQGFASMSMDEGKALLDELEGLGVLVKRNNGSYRLRNGNIVRALGSEQEISDRLIYMAELPAPDTADDASYRLKLDDQERSPLTIKQANELTRSRSGVGLVFGSEATGISAVPRTLQSLVASERCQQIPPDVVTLDQLLRLFKSSISRKQGGCIFYTFASDISFADVSLIDVIKEASKFFSGYNRHSSILRWILIFDVFSTQKWFEDFAEGWEEGESQVDAVVYLTRWDQKMIKRYLTDLDTTATDLIVNKIYNVTGGYPYLLNKLWELMKDPAIDQNPLKAANLLKENLEGNVDGMADDFLTALGINEVECGLEMIQMFKDLGPLHFNEIDEGIKTFGDVKLQNLCQKKVRSSLLTLLRLNVLVERENGLVVEPVVSGVIKKNDDP